MDKFEMWNSWGDIHNDADQKKRIESAKKANMTPVSVDENDLSGEFVGSAKYHVTLLTCNCSDFRRRGLPCKHIYRLAIELGLLDEQAKSDSSKIRTAKSERIAFPDAVDRVEKLSDPQRELLGYLLKEMLYNNIGKPVLTNDIEDAQSLIDAELMIVNDSADNIDSMFQRINKAELLNRLSIVGYTGFKKSVSKQYLIDFAKENIKNVKSLFPDMVALSINGKLEGAQRKLYSYLLRRDEEEGYIDETGEIYYIPHGAEFHPTKNGDWELQFPDDDITMMLNRYGVNKLNK